jgi:acyl-CoA hydrolase
MDFNEFKNGSYLKTNPVQQKIRDKTITAKQFADMVKSGDWINIGVIGSEATVTRKAIFERLGEGKDKLQNIELYAADNAYCGTDYGLKYDKEGKYHVQHQGFIHEGTRDAVKKGWQGFDWFQWGWAVHMNTEFARFYRKEKANRVFDWGIAPVAKPERNYVNGSYGASNFMITAKTCKKFVAEIREDYAWCEPGRNVNLLIDDVDYFVEVDCSNPEYCYPQFDERDIKFGGDEEKIANHILSIMRDGDCIQVGVGKLPTAVVIALSKSDLKHIGVHTEMIGEFAFTLAEKGILDNSRKSIDVGRCAWAYAAPFNTKRYFEWMHHNPFFAAYDINYTNNILNIAHIDNFVGVMNFAQMDLRGQVCSSNVAGRPISNTGGQLQFVLGGQMSKGGRSILAATSRTANGKPRFVPKLELGSMVDVPSQYVSYVATEYGIVNLMACTDAEKARRLISIAHPEDREYLEKEAINMGLKVNHWMFTSCPDRRYPTTEELKDHRYAYMNPIVIPGSIAKPND